MYQGKIQSGKSFVQFVLLWTSCFVHERGTIHLLMNRTDSLLQNINRDYTDFRETIKNICNELNIEDFENYIFDYRAFPVYAQRENVADSIYTVRVAMANTSQLTRIKEVAREERKCIVRDESDDFEKNDGPVMNLIEEIISESEAVYDVTATPFSNFNKVGQVYNMIVTIPTNPNYRGYNSDKIRYHEHTTQEIKELKSILENILTQDTREYKSVTLVNIDSHIGAHEEIKRKIERDLPGVFTIVIMNSQSDTYVRPLTYMMDHLINVPNEKPIIIIAGGMASRAVTFRTSRRNPRQGIITSMIYDPSKNSHQTNIMQNMRPFGNYDESCPDIHLYATREVFDAMAKSFLNNQALTEGIKPNEESRKCLENIPIRVITNRKFSQNDDSSFEKLDCTEFDSHDELMQFVTNEHNRYSFTDTVLTCEPDITYVDVPARTSKTGVNERLKRALGYQRGNHHLHTAWGHPRYEQLFSIKNRIQSRSSGTNNYSTVNFTCGTGETIKNAETDVRVPCITWRSGYEDATTWKDEDKVYIFRTTTGKWKAWIPRQMGKFKKIVH